MTIMLTVRSGSELAVQKRLKDEGVETIVPIEWIKRRVSRYAKRRGWSRRAAIQGYVAATRALAVKGVTGAVRDAEGRAIRLSEADVVRLQEMSQDEPPTPLPPRVWQVGDRVRIKAGPFAGAVTTITAVSPKLVTVEVQLFRSPRQIEVQPWMIAAMEG